VTLLRECITITTGKEGSGTVRIYQVDAQNLTQTTEPKRNTIENHKTLGVVIGADEVAVAIEVRVAAMAAEIDRVIDHKQKCSARLVQPVTNLAKSHFDQTAQNQYCVASVLARTSQTPAADSIAIVDQVLIDRNGALMHRDHLRQPALTTRHF